jgi:hypothetical protein
LPTFNYIIYFAQALPHKPGIMPKREIRHPDKEKGTGAYSSAVEIDGWVFVSGQGPVDPKTAQPVRGTIEEETLYTLNQVKKILSAAGCCKHYCFPCHHGSFYRCHHLFFAKLEYIIRPWPGSCVECTLRK